MKLVIAIAAFAGWGIATGANQIATGTTRQITEKIGRQGMERSFAGVAGRAAVISVALMRTSFPQRREATGKWFQAQIPIGNRRNDPACAGAYRCEADETAARRR